MFRKFIPQFVRNYLLRELIENNISEQELINYDIEGELLKIICQDGTKLSCMKEYNLPATNFSYIPETHTSAVLTYITRYKFPHFQPSIQINTGFVPRARYPFYLHPQHKNTIAEIIGESKNEISEAIQLLRDDQVLEVGPM